MSLTPKENLEPINTLLNWGLFSYFIFLLYIFILDAGLLIYYKYYMHGRVKRHKEIHSKISNITTPISIISPASLPSTPPAICSGQPPGNRGSSNAIKYVCESAASKQAQRVVNPRISCSVLCTWHFVLHTFSYQCIKICLQVTYVTFEKEEFEEEWITNSHSNQETESRGILCLLKTQQCHKVDRGPGTMA